LPNKFPEIWENTKKMFSIEIKSINELNNLFYRGKAKFFEELEKSFPEDGEKFLKVYKNISKLVLDMKDIFPDGEIEILKSKTTDKIILTRKEVALIFVLGFFDIFGLDVEKLNISINYNFFNVTNSSSGPSFAKGRSFINYMTVIGKWLEENNPILNEKITYLRENKQVDIENFKNIQKLCDIEIIEQGSMFNTEAKFCIDFANKYIGGGALSGGCVQEEILFAVEPEAIVSMFLMEVMDDNDAIRIDNLIQYSNYSGYAFSFKYEESAIKDEQNLIRHNIIAIDAVCSYSGGVDKESIKRDLIKAYVGFNLINFDDKDVAKMPKTISSGNWGCGAFGGDYELKFIQQWLAATYAGVEKLYYYTFGENEMNTIVKYKEEMKSLNADDLLKTMMSAKLYKGYVLNIILNGIKNNNNYKETGVNCTCNTH
jgi:poly(ADP-ribose) glycohydrolase